MPKRGARDLVACLIFAASSAAAVDLKTATIVTAPNLTTQEKNAVTMLGDEIEKRTRIRLPVATSSSGATSSTILINANKHSTPAEGFSIETRASIVTVTGNDARGTLFGIGALLRNLRMERDILEAPDNLKITTAPKYPLRGHQLGYRPKTNSYDGWDVRTWDQYIRDLAIFGTNAIELIPPRSDDAADSPHFPLPPMQMMTEMSRIADSYGLDVWIWYPAMDKDYSDPATVEFALHEWEEVYKKLPRIDAIFVPGGDPGHTEPKYLMPLLAKQTVLLHKYHPKAQMWVSPQSFNKEWMDQFLAILNNEQPAWLSGVVFGPQVRLSLPALRAAVPARYPIRHYPDITHSRQSQYPVPDWDVAFAATEAREVINPRPNDQVAIFDALQPFTIGFLTYSEGCNDDVNKFIWSGLGWNPEATAEDILTEYSRYFIGYQYADSFTRGLLGLEQNWRGPIAAKTNIENTLAEFQAMEKAASPATLANWRFQQGLYRAYYDAYVRRRVIHETEIEARAMAKLRETLPHQGARPSVSAQSISGLNASLDEAERVLDTTLTDRVALDLRGRIFELAEALFQSIRMQLSVAKYKAISTDRGATLDTVDNVLNNRGWLKAQFAEIRKNTNQSERLKQIDRILNWEDPGPGGFYDDLGNLARQPHLVRGLPYDRDPAFLQSSYVGHSYRAERRSSWWTTAETLGDTPLQMRYTGLDRSAQYKIRITYAGDSPNIKMRLVAQGAANDKIEIHPLIAKPNPIAPIEFEIPKAATQSGELNLSWTREAALGGNGRGNQVAEVWLIKE
jgi:Glycosyl hydrolase family 20, domain 2